MDDQRPILERLDHISATLDELLAVVKVPRNIVLRALEIAAIVVGILSIVGVFDTILGWFGG